jgi:uncharacterized membrane protein YfhO
LDKNLLSRPERVGPALPIPYPGEMIIQFWNSNDLKRTYSTGGYVTIKGNANFEKYVEYAMDNEKSKLIKFLQEKSQVKFIDSSTDKVDICLIQENCETKQIDYKFVRYNPGDFQIDFSKINSPMKVVVNEIGWKNWQALGCDDNGKCMSLEIGDEDVNLLLNVEVPAGIQSIEFRYITPGLNSAWVIFWTTILLVAILVFFEKRLKRARIHS